uniref:Uncharacterized protein n=1 Tax=Lepeophtheirus salmonis TaxID=72036 RepID=A0A0K2SWQ3_LEPSM
MYTIRVHPPYAWFLETHQPREPSFS